MKVYMVKEDRWVDFQSFSGDESHVDMLKIFLKKEDAISFAKEAVNEVGPLDNDWFERFVTDDPEPEGDIFETGRYWYEDEDDMAEDPDYIGEYSEQYYRVWVEEWEVE